ncbi:MAG: hypothetical protein MI725_05610 [Pirellulales bacterium]|nr:hypothetical protein [Pirellulales bacterium]
MGRINETIRTVNSAVRTLLLAALLAVAGFAGWKGYALYNEPQEKLAEKQRELDQVRADLLERDKRIVKITADLEEKTAQLERAEFALRLLKINHRIARLKVLDQKTDPETQQLVSTIEFFEVNNEGAPISQQRQKFDIEGDRVYVECLVAKFEDQYVEAADLDRATAICSFQRIFGEHQEPAEGYALDEVGASPTSYARGGKVSEFEQRIWDDFWEIANDRKKSAEIGIRAAHANATSTKVRKGSTYELLLRSTGEFTLKPIASN